MLTVAAFNHARLVEAGVPHRFTLVEWNPPEGKPPLIDRLRERLPWWHRSWVVSRAWQAWYQETFDDLYRYVWDGRVQAAGLNPYSYAPADPELAALRDDRPRIGNGRSACADSSRLLSKPQRRSGPYD
jgi:hypothetical protein